MDVILAIYLFYYLCFELGLWWVASINNEAGNYMGTYYV